MTLLHKCILQNTDFTVDAMVC